MKYLLPFILLLSSSLATAQFQRATLYFKNGKIIRGYAKILNNHKIRFQQEKRGEKVDYGHEKLDGIDINQDGRTIEYKFKIIKKNNKTWLLELVREGKIGLYRIYSVGTVSHNNDGFSHGFTYSINTYFLCRDNDDFVTRLSSTGTSGKKFARTASEYFSDCPELVTEIQNKTYSRDDLEEIVKYYNKRCN